MKDRKLYWSKFFQFSEDTIEIDGVLESMPPNKAAEYLGSVYDGYEALEDDFTTYKPYCANNGTDLGLGSGNGYTLLYNQTLGGTYLLYREATPEEKEWYFITMQHIND